MKYETDRAIISFLKHRLHTKQALHNAWSCFFMAQIKENQIPTDANVKMTAIK